jgi:hypothetical protein
VSWVPRPRHLLRYHRRRRRRPAAAATPAQHQPPPPACITGFARSPQVRALPATAAVLPPPVVYASAAAAAAARGACARYSRPRYDIRRRRRSHGCFNPTTEQTSATTTYYAARHVHYSLSCLPSPPYCPRETSRHFFFLIRPHPRQELKLITLARNM